MPTLRLPPDQIAKVLDGITPTREDLDNLAFFLHQQVEDRFRTQGRSGDAPWPVRSPITIAGKKGRAMLTGRSSRLREGFSEFVTGGDGSWTIGIENAVPYARVHQLGTEKYGGPIPTIRPVTAKALFIPITDRAAASDRLEGPKAAAVHRLYGKPKFGPVRAPNRGRKWTKTRLNRLAADEGLSDAILSSGAGYHAMFSPLKRGRISKHGELEVWDERTQKYKTGIPDFIFLKKVDIAPRPMLPDGEQEQQAQIDFLASIGAGAA